ncbi:MAG: methyltransferase, partial [Bacteroidota bacterium]
KILDIGTGTGLIAIMLAQRQVNASIHAVEIDELASEQARRNIAASPWSARLEVFTTSIQDFCKDATEKPYDLIVSNPPFFSGGTFSENQNRNHVRHTIKLPHGDLLSAVRLVLAKEGRFCLVLPFIEGLRFEEMAKNYGFHCTKKTEIHPKADKPIERLLLQFERQAKPLEVDKLVIQKTARNDWTEAYIALTKDFYLKM